MDDDRRLSSRLFTLGLLVIAGWGAWTATGWRYEARLAPLTASILFGVFTLYQFVRTEVAAARRATPPPPDDDDNPPAALVAPTLVEAAVAATHVAEEVTEAAGAPRPKPATDPEPGVLGQFKGVVWCFVALALIILLGIVIGLPLATFALCRFAFGEKWYVTIATVAVVGAILWVFDYVFAVFWPVGLIFQWLGMY